jgi:phage/plasmid-like protein (TIGR03299 family)
LIPSFERHSAWGKEGGFVTFNPEDDVNVHDAMEVSGLNTPVTLHSIYSHNGVEIPNKVETWRDGRHMAVVGKGTYHVIQTESLIPFLEAVLYESPYRLVAMGKWDMGRKEMIVFEWPEGLLIGGEPYKGYGYVFNSHDGSTALSFVNSMQRIACTNEVGALLKGASVKLRHTASWSRNIELVRQTLDVRLAAQEQYEAEVKRDLAIKFDDSDFQAFIDAQFPLKDKDGKVKEGRSLTMAFNARDTLGNSWNAPDLADVRGTLYGAKQALVAYYDWGYGSDKHRAVRQLEGTTDRLKRQGAVLLDAIAGV